MKKPVKQSSIGIDISDNRLKAVIIEVGDDNSITVRSYTTVRLDIGTMKNGLIKDDKRFKSALLKLKDQIDADEETLSNTVISLPEPSVFILSEEKEKNEEIDKQKLDKTAEEKLKHYSSRPPDEFVYYHYIRKLGNKARINYAYTPKENLSQLENIFTETGYKLTAIEPESESNLRSLVRLDKIDTIKPVLILDIGEFSSSLSILDNLGLFTSKEIPLGGYDFTIAIAKELHIPTSQAEEIKENHGLQSPKHMKKVKPAVGDLIKKLHKNISSSLIYYKEKTGKDVYNIFLIGGGANLAGLEKELGKVHSADTKHANTWIAHDLQMNIANYTTSLGLAIRGLGLFSTEDTNFLKQEKVPKKNGDKENKVRTTKEVIREGKDKVSDCKKSYNTNSAIGKLGIALCYIRYDATIKIAVALLVISSVITTLIIFGYYLRKANEYIIKNAQNEKRNVLGVDNKFQEVLKLNLERENSSSINTTQESSVFEKTQEFTASKLSNDKDVMIRTKVSNIEQDTILKASDNIYDENDNLFSVNKDTILKADQDVYINLSPKTDKSILIYKGTKFRIPNYPSIKITSTESKSIAPTTITQDMLDKAIKILEISAKEAGSLPPTTLTNNRWIVALPAIDTKTLNYTFSQSIGDKAEHFTGKVTYQKTFLVLDRTDLESYIKAKKSDNQNQYDIEIDSVAIISNKNSMVDIKVVGKYILRANQ